MFDKKRSREIAQKVLSFSKADEAHVSLDSGWTTHLRFARNSPSTSGNFSNPSLTVRSTFGKRTGTATVNQFDDKTLQAAVRRAEQLARVSPEDPEKMPALAQQTYLETNGFSQATADGGAEKMVDGVATCIKEAADNGLTSAGFAMTSARASSIANSNGLFAYDRSTTAYISETARTKDATGSGWASQSSHQASDIDYGKLARSAASKAKGSAKPRSLAPGKYVTILEPACVANLVGMMMWSMSARSADEGRSYFSAKGGGNRLGEKLFGDQVNVYSDPADPLAPARPWTGSGLPQRRRDWVNSGTLANLTYDRYWAAKQKKEPVPFPSNMIMTGGKGSLDDLIASTKRGVLVTSLWYIRSLDPRTLLYTGLTRDGVFWIEDGKIAHPVTNFRWNDSPISVLKNIDAMTASVRIPPRPRRSANTVVPALRLKEFHFSSVSEAV